jgi:undecaprenyl-diphosphatase
MLLALGLTFLFTDLTKELVGRLRPNNSEPLSQLVRILQRPTDYSFFSGHASSSFVITTFVFLSVRKFNKWILLAYLWPLLFVVSRIYVGVHYPSDIIAGALAGVLVAFLFYYISKVILNRI